MKDKDKSLLAPLSDLNFEALMTDTPVPTREPNEVQLQWCPTCRQWMRAGSAEAGHCIDCGHPRQ